MADIFLSYARESAETATRVAATLRSDGYSVWFDEELPAHRAYADVIASELDAARAVLVLWSEAAAALRDLPGCSRSKPVGFMETAYRTGELRSRAGRR